MTPLTMTPADLIARVHGCPKMTPVFMAREHVAILRTDLNFAAIGGS